mmetsp:Transcript_120128/g.208574  ORF Transcript_120128/g.208574 Transcript_120128/m.208574 type:complete len:119 (+) Transcript_120128:195-551(+)
MLPSGLCTSQAIPWEVRLPSQQLVLVQRLLVVTCLPQALALHGYGQKQVLVICKTCKFIVSMAMLSRCFGRMASRLGSRLAISTCTEQVSGTLLFRENRIQFTVFRLSSKAHPLGCCN